MNIKISILQDYFTSVVEEEKSNRSLDELVHMLSYHVHVHNEIRIAFFSTFSLCTHTQ